VAANPFGLLITNAYSEYRPGDTPYPRADSLSASSAGEARSAFTLIVSDGFRLHEFIKSEQKSKP
jgi:hypothetical protein